jgi:two-component system sensor histidine kinase TctE
LARSLKDGFEGLRSFDSSHRGALVKVVQLRQTATIDQLSGQVVVSVWQNLSERAAFARRLALRGAVIALLLIVTVAVVVFFGIRIGLRPLSALESALVRRSGGDLSPIRRKVPQEVSHIVKRLNGLFATVTEAQSQKDRFISNAAHQLRNPVAAIASMAEVAGQAKTLKDARARNALLHAVSKDLSRLTEQMLSFERLKNQEARKETLSFESYMQQISSAMVDKYRGSGVEMSFALSPSPQQLILDPLMIEQAVVNLVDNAVRHGGDTLSEITLSSQIEEGFAAISVANNGAPIKGGDVNALFERFVQGQEGEGSGLGLAIVQQIAHQHNGTLSYEPKKGWVCFTIRLPITGPITLPLADDADGLALDNR